ncbi:glycosyltransferase family 4 protein [Patescibacteria group bacterium]
MKILQIAPLWVPVPPITYGGTELVISWLTEELVRRGHDVTLLASGDSKTSAELIPIWPKSLWRTNVSAPYAVFSLLYEKVAQIHEKFDIIHDHCDFHTTPFSPFLKRPIVSTIHNPMHEEKIILFKKFPQIHYVAISKHQRKSASGVHFVKTIYHGLPIDQYLFNPKPNDYLLWLSRIQPDKGLGETIEIIKKTKEKLIISGNISNEHGDYFEYRIQPFIDGKQIQFVGASNFKKKIELFKNAKAFLFPISRRPEPFGLVVVEAMACGTPVLAYREGAIPELVKEEKTGFLVNNQREMVNAVKKIGQIDRLTCHRYVKKRFSLEKMVNKYEALYHTIIKDFKNGGRKKRI